MIGDESDDWPGRNNIFFPQQRHDLTAWPTLHTPAPLHTQNSQRKRQRRKSDLQMQGGPLRN